MTDKTPGQAAYERMHDAQRRRFPGIAPIGWDELDEEAQADWDGAAQDAIDASVAAIVKTAGGDTVLVAFKDSVTPEDAEGLLDRWAEYGPEGTGLVIVENVNGIDVAKAGPQPAQAARTALDESAERTQTATKGNDHA